MVIVYSRDSCAPCRTLKYWLNKRGVEYQEREPDATVTLVPTVEIGQDRIVGLNLPRLAEALAATTTITSTPPTYS